MAHFDVLKKYIIILEMWCSVNQIDDLQSSNKKQSWTFRLPWLGAIFMEQNMRFGLILGWLAIMKKINLPLKHRKNALKGCPNFFSVLPTSPKSAQISYSVPKKWLPARLLYNDFGYSLNFFLSIIDIKIVMCTINGNATFCDFGKRKKSTKYCT